MVYFDCRACGESLKKNQVEKHLYKCRNCHILTCIDCSKDFEGDAYKEHIKCITEDAKYGGKNYQAKANANKGERKQEAWTEQVEAAIDKVKDAQVRSLLQRVKGFTNIPRKKAKFENFLKNSVHTQSYLASKAWDAIAAEIPKPEPPQPATNGASTSSQNGAEENGTEKTESDETSEKKLNKREKKEERQKGNKKEKKNKSKLETEESEAPAKKSKKRKHEETDEEQQEEEEKSKKKKNKRKHQEVEAEEPSTSKKKKKSEEDLDTTQEEEEEEESEEPKRKFNWEGIIVHILKKNDGELPLKKLKKKTMAAFGEHGGSNSKTAEQSLVKFNKSVNKNKRFKVAKDRVKLVS